MPTTCRISTCTKDARANSLCNAHYKKDKKYGDPLAGVIILRGFTIEVQYWAKVDKRGPAECWPWTAHRNRKGYGMIADGSGGSVPAHRLGYELAHGSIPEGLTVDHSCHTPDCTLGNDCPHRACQNPAHLRVLTNADNVAFGNAWSAVNRRKTHCLRGHELTEANLIRKPWTEGRRVCRPCAEGRWQREHSA